MKDLDIGGLFCEVLSGVVALLIIVGALDLTNQVDLGSLVLYATANTSGWTIAGLMIGAFLAGIIVDAVGTTFDELVVAKMPWLTRVLKYDAGVMPRLFYATATQQQLEYWRDQWGYFSCYRNLLALSPFWVVIAVALAVKYGGCGWAFAVAAGGLALVACLAITIRYIQSALVGIARRD